MFGKGRIGVKTIDFVEGGWATGGNTDFNIEVGLRTNTLRARMTTKRKPRQTKKAIQQDAEIPHNAMIYSSNMNTAAFVVGSPEIISDQLKSIRRSMTSRSQSPPEGIKQGPIKVAKAAISDDGHNRQG